MRFPWRGGRHPCLDVLITTETALIGVEFRKKPHIRTLPSEIRVACLTLILGLFGGTGCRVSAGCETRLCAIP